MAYEASKIECVRFAGRKGQGIGCCAVDLLQGFNNDPDEEAYVGLTYGDSGDKIIRDKGQAFLGPTNRDIFLGYLRMGTFDTKELPDRVFLAAITKRQTEDPVGRKWLELMKENGFEFLTVVNNSVYGSTRVVDGKPGENHYPHPVYLFILRRNISTNQIVRDGPPEFWGTLPEAKSHLQIWQEGKEGRAMLLDEKDLVEAGKIRRKRWKTILQKQEASVIPAPQPQPQPTPFDPVFLPTFSTN